MIRRNVMKGTLLAALLALGTWGAIAIAQAPPTNDGFDGLDEEAFAYQDGPGMGMGYSGGMGMRHGRRMGMGPMGHLRQLDLTAQQKERIEAIHDTQRRTAIGINKDVELAQLDMRKLVRADTPDRRAIELQIDKMSALRAKLQKSRVGAMLDVRGVLTPEQRQKLEQLREQGPAGGGQRGPGPHGPNGPGGTPGE